MNRTATWPAILAGVLIALGLLLHCCGCANALRKVESAARKGTLETLQSPEGRKIIEQEAVKVTDEHVKRTIGEWMLDAAPWLLVGTGSLGVGAREYLKKKYESKEKGAQA